jgi:hypothetical protein
VFARAYPRVIGGRLDQQLSLLNTEFNSQRGLFKIMLILIRPCDIIVTERNRYADVTRTCQLSKLSNSPVYRNTSKCP